MTRTPQRHAVRDEGVVNRRLLAGWECEGRDLNPHAISGASTSSGKGGPTVLQGRENTSLPSPPGTLATPREDVGNGVANEAERLRAQIARLEAELAALRPALRRVK